MREVLEAVRRRVELANDGNTHDGDIGEVAVLPRVGGDAIVRGCAIRWLIVNHELWSVAGFVALRRGLSR